jgi:hypothetical protein
MVQKLDTANSRDVKLNYGNIAHVTGVKLKLIHDRRIILTFCTV